MPPADEPGGGPERLTSEAVAASPRRVDAEGRLVRGLALAGLVSRNGYAYRADALRLAAPLYEGRPVFLDHAADPSRPQSRSARDLVGTLSGVRFDDDADVLRGDVRVLDTESGRTFLALCEGGEEGVGMSHVVLARRSDDGREVVSVERVVSVDAVAFPATTQSLSESDGAPLPERSNDAPNEADDLREQVGRLAAERDDLVRRLAEAETSLRAADVRRRRETLLSESGLPRAAMTAPFRRAVLEAASESQADALVRDRVAIVEAGRGRWPGPACSEGPSDLMPGRDARFVRAVRGL